MNRLASPAQLRASFVRWALFLVPTVLLLGTLSGLAGGTAAEDPWFIALDKPSFVPPPAVFSIVWPVLYTLMGFAIATVCAAWGSRFRLPAIAAFFVQMLLNLVWTPLFFGAHEITLALVVIVLLDVALVLTIVLFWKVRRTAALLLLPALAWLLFGTVLNYEFMRLNPAADGAEVSPGVQRIAI